MPTVAFHTLGCKVNFYDTEAIWRKFQTAGYEQVAFEDRADVYVINTCTVTNTGDKKSRQMIRRAVRTNPDAVVAVTGCYAQMAPDEIAAMNGVDLVVGNDRKTKIVDLVEDIWQEQNLHQGDENLLKTREVGNILKTRQFEEMDVPYFEDRTRANLKIQDGCNNFCTFCIIPYARGLIRSRSPEKVVLQARKLAKAGYREIILTGIHTGGYGADLNGYRLAHLLKDLENIEELYRIRISSIEASEIDDELIEVLGNSSKACRHLHIPLQAGHNQVLRKMNRHYTVEEYAAKVRNLRQALPGLAVTSDVIVGFPGETDEFFEDTETLIRELEFSQLHVFPYSPRKGTPAAKFSDQVPNAVKEARTERLIELSNQLVERYAAQWLNRRVEVIPEEPYHLPENQANRGQGPWGRPGFWLMGHTDTYLKVAFPVPPGIKPEQLMGEVCEVCLSDCTSTFQFGEFVRQLTTEDDVSRADDMSLEVGGVFREGKG
ncbi:tRNA (N(6)-L-threonylcarbamoyladenosine(37)-C(2))-methylthiotransferase MtaB [Alicyclobacillus mengziensis]|uniref:Threonylcarbamoyladenosine tRNA methylthiotransferase MtaB n=1 Tax=Alicyclobacillus mengziensis TaxID=2931921 RepID=A0A9X7Z6D5_9BACL|nr:tRNA (N(6)-L-threonylcarbamoyladenosine(37)-C(2))-methylthiotransferase MtaB [Alicyclobacillus mengziensis]QSO46113.1 tRNA (N(6)-L-threonylcarbamoyladenosine(37)-C(2))-methylthiotransferase MtaB [Alicyclobacillus mengziensis]